MLDIYTMPQMSPEWFQAKLGIISTSHFSDVLAKGKGKSRKSYMLKLASEILTKTRRKTYEDDNMKRGVEQEPHARADYELITGQTVKQIGFAKRGRIGSSPDGLVEPDGEIEIKCVIPEVQIETILADTVPSTHKAQIQGSLFVLNRKWCDFISYSPLIKNKNYMFIKRMYRDETYISELQVEILRFIKELDELVKRMK